ncbi:MAG TPA: GNAT family N-acetyltransferase [Solirubrobacteraceae bacterium]|jgi:ribosomal protein S18 acetylase RimI-like enzyme
MSELEILPVVPERLEDLKALWQGLYDHHTGLMAHLRDRQLPFEQAWEKRRKIETQWLATEPRSFVLAGKDADRYLGYAFVRIRSGAAFAASWTACDPLAELAILVVLPEARGQGVGSALLDAVEARLAQMGIEDMTIGVIARNTEAMRLYERRGAVPFITEFIQRVKPRTA